MREVPVFTAGGEIRAYPAGCGDGMKCVQKHACGTPVRCRAAQPESKKQRALDQPVFRPVLQELVMLNVKPIPMRSMQADMFL